MFCKKSLILLYISLSGLVKGSFEDEFTTNVETNLQNLLGVNCMVESVLNLEDAADEFSYQIKNKCKRATDLAKELSNTKQLMKTTAKVIAINDRVCDNAGYNDELDAETEPSTECVENLTNHMAKLLKSFTQTSAQIDTGLLASYSSDACVKITSTNFKYFLGTFGSRIATCAELADQV